MTDRFPCSKYCFMTYHFATMDGKNPWQKSQSKNPHIKFQRKLNQKANKNLTQISLLEILVSMSSCHFQFSVTSGVKVLSQYSIASQRQKKQCNQGKVNLSSKSTQYHPSNRKTVSGSQHNPIFQ